MKGPDVLKDIAGWRPTASTSCVVEPTLQTTRDPNIFAIGDCAACPRPDEKTAACRRAPRRRTSRPRTSSGRSPRRLAGKPLKPFVYRDFGSLVSLGSYSTVGSLMGFLVGSSMFIEGYFARLMYRSLYKMHQIALHGLRRWRCGRWPG